ncbi:MAG TPA: N-6 DNA methylase [Flavobacterium lutivivi]|nr:N-6 DNA methylase [Flavobacterium lutivivi]
MSLFQNNVLKKYSNTFDKKMLDEKWQLFITIFHNTNKQDNIRNSKEEQYQEGFLRDLFVQILGYTLNPDADYNLISEQKNETNSKKADGAIILNENIHAVIELKGTDTTDLAKIENQAFGYKNNQKNCSYVIISNFEKLRFYIDNATEYIEFNLFTLSRAEFDLLYTCLSLESMQTDLSKKIKNESVSNEDKITKELYKDYSAFRRELFTDIEKLNPQYDRLLLFKKTQKLLDRFLFIFFAEDRQLLPTNLIFSINLEWQKLREARVPVSLYDRYKMYFQDLNTGARVSLPAFGKHTNEIVTAQYDIYAYNGGLFQTDEILDTIAINDDLLFKHSKKLSEYDFESEVDVNILGHIFENSLNEIDEITNAIDGQEVDKTKTKRKKDGVFYTPKYITKYIVDNTIGKLCEEKKAELEIKDEIYQPAVQRSRKRLNNLAEYRNWLIDLTIVDPACGSGAFLNQALEFLINEHRYIDELSAKYNKDTFQLTDVEGSILENNLYGVDLNEESVEIAKLSLWLRTAQRNRKLNSLNNNIKCGNSLIDDATIAGDKAFNWQNEFPQVFEKGGFDVVIGNPPYLNMTKANTGNLFLDYYINKFESIKNANSKNIYTLFNEMSSDLVKRNGIVSFIIPEGFLKTRSYDDCVKLMNQNGKIIKAIYFDDWVFEDATTGSMIFEYIKNKDSKVNFEEYLMSKNRDLLKIENKKNSIIEKYNKLKFPTISELTDTFKGMAVQNREQFIFSERNDLPNKFLLGNCIDRYLLKKEFYCDFNKLTIVGGTKKIEKHNISPRILIRRTGNFLCCVLLIEPALTESTLYSSSIKVDNLNIYYLLSILNSKLLTYVVRQNMITNEQAFPQIMMTDVQLLKIPIIKNQNALAEKATQILNLNKNLQEASLKFIKYFSGQFKLEKLSSKLEKWYEVSFEEFIKEINKAIKAQKGTPLTKKDEFDWMDVFKENKQKANALQHQIATTDKAIDAMVYELYGLSEEEIAIVENS